MYQFGESMYRGNCESQKSVIGVIHLLPLPGTPNSKCSLEQVITRALADAQALYDGGVRIAILENFGDAPFVRGAVEPHIVAMMTRIALEINSLGLSLGLNVLRNDAHSAMAIAAAVGASFIRVNVHTGAAWTDQGLIQGEAYQTLMYRQQLGGDVAIAADVMVKHATPAGTRTLLDAAKDTVYRGGAEFLIVTGTATGATIDIEELKILREALPMQSIWIGSGVNPTNVQNVLAYADAVIVGTHFHREGQLTEPLEQQRVEAFMALVKTIQESKT